MWLTGTLGGRRVGINPAGRPLVFPPGPTGKLARRVSGFV
jgi:hypothetical protein